MKIKSAEEIESGRGTYLLYGTPGMGKTSTVKYLPGKSLVLDVDRTSHVLKGCKNIDICYIDTKETWADWEQVLLDLTNNYKGAYDNIIVDNVSSLESRLLTDLGMKGKNQGVPAQGDYQRVYFRIKNSLEYLKSMDCRIFMLAWEEQERYQDANGQMYDRVSPKIAAKIKPEILGLCDVVGRLMINAEGKRGYVLEASNSVYAKNQLDDRKGCLQEELVPDASV